MWQHLRTNLWQGTKNPIRGDEPADCIQEGTAWFGTDRAIFKMLSDVIIAHGAINRETPDQPHDTDDQRHEHEERNDQEPPSEAVLRLINGTFPDHVGEDLIFAYNA